MPRRFSARAVLHGFAYRLRHHPSFYVSVLAHLIGATATVGFILAFIQQASYTGNTRRLNIVIIAALVGAVLFTSCFLILARIIAVRTSFNTIPKPYIPTKHIDVPRKVAEHITREYTRTGVIAYISQPTAGKQEGWGRPGTQFASIHFRTSIRETFHAILKTLDDHSPRTPHITYPPYAIRQITTHPSWPPHARPLLDMYDALLTKAKYARSEPDAHEYERCIKIVALIMGLIKTSHQAPPDPDRPETPARRTSQEQEQEQERTVLVASPTPVDDPAPGTVHTVPEAHLGSPYEAGTGRSRSRGTWRAGRWDRPTVVVGDSSSDEDEWSSRDGNDRAPGVEGAGEDARDEVVLPEPAATRDGRLTRRRRESTTAGLPHLFRRHHDEDDDPEAALRQGHEFSFASLRTLPRMRRRETTRYAGDGSEGEREREPGRNGTAGFLHSVWGAGRPSDGE